MPFFHDQSRSQLRQMYVDAWRKRREKLPVEPLEAQIGDLVEEHPEYHTMLTGDAALERDYSPEAGESNPFLHLSMHMAIREQVATDRPPGIRAAFETLAKRRGSGHTAEHEIIECLGEALWNAQRAGSAPDEQVYLENVRKRARS
jgi:hypothetical protein